MCCLLLCKTSWFHSFSPPYFRLIIFQVFIQKTVLFLVVVVIMLPTLFQIKSISSETVSLFQTLRHIYPKCQVKERKAVVAFEVQWERSSNARALQGLALPMQVLFLSFFFSNARRRESSGDRCFNARCADDCDLACAWVFFCSFCPWPSRALSSLLLQVHQREKSGSNLWWPSIGGGAARDREWHYFSRFLTLKHTYLLCSLRICNLPSTYLDLNWLHSVWKLLKKSHF